jgi:septum formation protein
VLVLASASPRRRALLRELGLPFAVLPSDADETLPRDVSPERGAELLAERKARTVALRTPLPVLGADTLVVAADGEVLGKPSDAADAARMLRKLSGTAHRVVTGVALALAGGRRVATDHAVTHVTMRPLSEAEVEAYAGSGEGLGKAGGYALQETGERFVVALDGSWSNVVGLPLGAVRRLLASVGLP